MKVEAFAHAYHSNSTAYGELYIPHDLYIGMKDYIDKYTYYVNDLNGKHSEVETEPLEVSTITLQEAVEQEENHDETICITESISEILAIHIDEELEEDNGLREFLYLEELTSKVNDMKKDYNEFTKGELEEILVVEAKVNGVVQEVTLPIGSVVKLNKKPEFDYNVDLSE